MLRRQQLYFALLHEIAERSALMDGTFPSRRSIQRTWKVSQETAEWALGELVKQGILERRVRHAFLLSPNGAPKARRLCYDAEKPRLVRGAKASAQMPRGRRLFSSLLEEIAAGAHGEGKRFLSQRRIEQLWKVSRPTVERARGILITHGLLEKSAGGLFCLTEGAVSKARLLRARVQVPPLPPPTNWRSRRNRILAERPEDHYRIALVHDQPGLSGAKIEALCRKQSRSRLASQRHSQRDLADFYLEAERRGCRCECFYSSDDPTSVRQLLDTLNGKRFHGVTVSRRLRFTSRRLLLDGIRRLGFPVMTLFDDCELEADTSVDFNEVAAGCRAMKILLEHGHRDICVVTLDSDLGYLSQRIEGAEACLREMDPGKTVNLQVRVVPEPFATAGTLSDLFTKRGQGPDALLVVFSPVLPRLGKEIHEAGLSIPRDLSVIACGTSSFRLGPFGCPDFLDRDIMHLARIGVRQMIRLMAGETLPRILEIGMPYRRRGTVARSQEILNDEL